MGLVVSQGKMVWRVEVPDTYEQDSCDEICFRPCDMLPPFRYGTETTDVHGLAGILIVRVAGHHEGAVVEDAIIEREGRRIDANFGHVDDVIDQVHELDVDKVGEDVHLVVYTEPCDVSVTVPSICVVR